MNRKARIAGIVLLVLLGLVYVPRLGLIMFSAMWAAGDGNGNLASGFSFVWRAQGGIKGFLHIASDLELVQDPDSLIAERAAGRLLSEHQCEKQDRILAILKAKPNNALVRVKLMDVLAICKDNRLVPVLREALQEDNLMIVGSAALSTGMLGARELVPELESAVARCANAQCAGSAAMALSRLGEKKVAYPWAIKALSDERPAKDPKSEDSYRRMYAGQILENIGTVADIDLIEKNRSPLGVYAEYHKKAILDRESANQK
jgi:hypothetical protein